MGKVRKTPGAAISPTIRKPAGLTSRFSITRGRLPCNYQKHDGLDYIQEAGQANNNPR